MSEEEKKKIAILRSLEQFDNQGDEFFRNLAACMEEKRAPCGSVLVEERKAFSSIIIVESGTLCRTRRSQDGENILTVDEIAAGHMTGYLHVLDNALQGNVAYATVTCVGGDCCYYCIEQQAFMSVLESNSTFMRQIIAKFASWLKVGSKTLRSLTQQAADRCSEEGGRGGVGGSKTIRVLTYDTTNWVREGFIPAVEAYNSSSSDSSKLRIIMDFTADRLNEDTAQHALGYDAVCLFVNDTADDATLKILSMMGVKMVGLRCAGFDRVDCAAAAALDMTVARVPAYSPYAVAEHAIALLMALNRKIHQALSRVKGSDFTLDSSLMGVDIFGKTVAVMGTGKIGQCLCNILLGFGANLVCYDVFENEEVKAKGGKYVSQDEVWAQSDIIFFMMPLLASTHHTLNMEMLPKLKRGVLLINTSRGGLIDTKSLISGLLSGQIGGVGLDVFENEVRRK
jgi:D-lactate dehydrogenase